MPLSVSIVSPISGAALPGPSATVVVSATAVSTHPIERVEFFSGASSIGSAAPTVTTYNPLISGTVALTNAVSTVVGTGTSFLTDFSVNDYVMFSNQPGAIYRVLSIASNIGLTLTTPFTGSTTTSTTMRSVSLFPYFSIAWAAVAVGSYSLTAVVTDITGAASTSSAVPISVAGLIGSTASSVSGSSIGFGHNPFGNHQFGFGDWAEEMLWKNLPQVYKDCDEAGPRGSTVQNPLRKFQDALKPSYQDLRVRWHEFTYLWDAIRVPLDQLPQLGYNVGITVDASKSEGLQRSSVLNASQLWINKGTDKGYSITAAFEGLLVTITPLWAVSCGAASQELGTVGDVPASFSLDDQIINSRPVGPGTLHIKVTTSYGTIEDIHDDEMGGLIGSGNRLNGPLTRLEITQAVTLIVNSIVGLFSVGDIVTQGLASGTIIASVGSRITIQVTAGSFGAGPLLDTTSLATANVTSTDANVLAAGETIEGLSSGTTAVLRDFETTYTVVDRITSLAGFTIGETLRGLTSGLHAVAGTSTALVEGPLRPRLVLSSVVGAFSVGDEVAGGTSGSTAIVRELIGADIYVDTITQPGLLAGETISTGPNSATVDQVINGTVNYLTGALSGHTVELLAGSTVEAVVDLVTTGPSQFVANYDAVIGDEIPLDRIESDRYARWPATYEPIRVVNGIATGGECRSYSLRLFFYTPDDTEIENFDSVAPRIQQALETFRPIHVRFDKISFDGARASSQVWRTGAIDVESAAASVWTARVVGNQMASSQVWSLGPFSATVES